HVEQRDAEQRADDRHEHPLARLEAVVRVQQPVPPLAHELPPGAGDGAGAGAGAASRGAGPRAGAAGRARAGAASCSGAASLARLIVTLTFLPPVRLSVSIAPICACSNGPNFASSLPSRSAASKLF